MQKLDIVQGFVINILPRILKMVSPGSMRINQRELKPERREEGILGKGG